MPKQEEKNPNRRVVPYNNEAEIYVLGSIIIDNTVMNIANGKLIDKDFYTEKHQTIYQAMVSLYNQELEIEPLSILDEMRRLKIEIDDELKEYLFELVDTVPSTASANLYIDIVKEKAIERELLNQMKELSDDILVGNLSFNSLLDKAEDRIQTIIKKRRTSQLLPMSQAADKVYEHIRMFTADKNNLRGISSGFRHLDQTTLGFQKGNFIILAARPSVGKSALALNLAMNACRTDKDNHVAFFSLEMSIDELLMRLFSYESKVPMKQIQTGRLNNKEMVLLGHACKTLKMHNIYFDESNSSDIYDIRAKCRQLKQTGRLDMVVIDYLQLITSSDSRGNRQEEVARISRSLKILAQELEVPVIALSQLSRQAETREDNRPGLADLRESGSIEQDADVVMFLYRKAKKKKKEGEEEAKEVIVEVEQVTENEESSEQILNLYVAKNRQGALRDLPYVFTPAICHFQESKYITKTEDN